MVENPCQAADFVFILLHLLLSLKDLKEKYAQRTHLYCMDALFLGSIEFTRSSLILTGRGGICFIMSGTSLILQNKYSLSILIDHPIIHYLFIFAAQ
jgi:hypothetical protein